MAHIKQSYKYRIPFELTLINIGIEALPRCYVDPMTAAISIFGCRISLGARIIVIRVEATDISMHIQLRQRGRLMHFEWDAAC